MNRRARVPAARAAFALGLGLAGASACGDNAVGRDAGIVRPDARPGCSNGDVIYARLVAPGCGTPGAPASPACLDGAVVLVTSPPDDLRLFALERPGRIRILDAAGRLAPRPFLDLSADAGGPIIENGEMGLLGLAFHPKYATNRLFYVFYTGRNPDPLDTGNPFVNVLARFTASATDPGLADLESGEILISIPDFAANHNGGMLEFGADGLLYVSTGDGGGGINGDPEGNGQKRGSLLAKILRIDVDRAEGGKPYGIPPGNPFAAGGGVPEAFVLGLRNPWRFSFDRATGDLWIGDVGHAEFEELDVLRPGRQAGANLGWSMYEAHSCYRAPCDPTGVVFPQHVRSHAVDRWSAIIGGQVYRGDCFPAIHGWYFFTDNGAGGLAKARLRQNGSLEVEDVPGEHPLLPTSIHAAGSGELYEADVKGNIYRIETR
ncbi:MAG TPA: PQQ-dependent sugar dehydrogenase [Kofleriaceae bacterium]|nr:PQQ-dependent sugar dehydrogenase [Kofleriaceae bacterium]